MGRRSGRAAAKRAAAALESTPKTYLPIDDDEPMPDAQDTPSKKKAAVEEPSKDTASGAEEAIDEAANDEATEEIGDETIGQEENNEDEDEASAKSQSPVREPVVRRKRLGRPPKNRPLDWDALPLERSGEKEAESTPRRRGRGGWRGRGGRKGQHVQQTQQPIDKDGNLVDIVNDEVDLPEDPEGETKVDKLGILQGGREYRCRTFTVQGRGDRLYMLSTEPARCVGFRDSYLFFTKHKRLYKIIVDDEEKRDMIDRDIIPHSYKGRAIGIVTARSVFREFGALIIVGGKKIIDDYEVAKAREEGVVEGELADPNDVYDPEKPYNKNQYVAWHGASAVYHSAGPSVPQQSTKAEVKKRRVAVNDVNWQLEHAREASQFNSTLTAARAANLNGVYDVHTNSILYPGVMQPTHARIEQVADSENSEPPSSSTSFPPLKTLISRNFLVTDIHMESPPAGVSPAAYDLPFRTSAESRRLPGRADFLSPFRGLGSVPDDVRDLLPEDCRRAFDDAVTNEDQWFSTWGDESKTMCRREPVIDKAIVPYSMPLV